MAEVDYNEINTTTDYSHTGNTNWDTQTSVAAANIQNADYLVIGSFLQGGNAINTAYFSFRVAEGSTELDSSFSETTVESGRNTAAYGKPASVLSKHSFGGSSNLNVQIRTLTSSSNTAYLPRASLLMIKVDDTDTDTDALHSGDYEYSYSGTQVDAVADTWVDLESITIGNGSDDYVVFARCLQRTGSFSGTLDHRLDVGGSPVEQSEQKRSNSGEYIPGFIMTYLAAPAASTVVKHQYRSNSALGDVSSNSIMAIRLNAFDDYTGLLNTSDLTMSSNDTDYQRTLTHTSDHSTGTAENWLAFGWSQIDWDANNKQIDTYLRQGSSTIFAGTQTGDAGYVYKNDSPYPLSADWVCGAVNIADNTDIDIDFGHQEESNASGSGPTIKRMSIVAFTAEKEPEATTSPLLTMAANNAGF